MLRRAGQLGYDKHLLLLQPHSIDLTGATPFYQSVLQPWQVQSFRREAVMTPRTWLFEEPLFRGGFIRSQVLSLVSLRSRLRDVGCVKLGHLMKTSIPHLAELLLMLNIGSNRLLLRVVENLCSSLPGVLRVFVEDRTLSEQWDDECEYIFPALSPSVGQWQDEDDILLSLKTPELGDHVMHFNSSTRDNCTFCSGTETIYHLFVQNSRLTQPVQTAAVMVSGLGEQFSLCLFISGHITLPTKGLYTLHLRTG